MSDDSKHIYLVGFMGSGKSTVGPILAGKMDRSFYDLDDMIEEEQGLRISEIFEKKGEPFFRELESRLLVRSQDLEICVMALGGGAFINELNREIISTHGLSVWLDVPLPLARERCLAATYRPLARDPKEFESLFQRRKEFYRLADIRIQVERKSPSKICAEIKEELPSFS